MTQALLKPQIHFLLGPTKGNGKLETQEFDPTEIKTFYITSSSQIVSENSFSWDIVRSLLLPANGKDMDLYPLITVSFIY